MRKEEKLSKLQPLSMKFKNESWKGKMTAKAAWKLGYITDEEWRQWKTEQKARTT